MTSEHPAGPWSAAQYWVRGRADAARAGSARRLPSRDVRAAVDIGCGPGNSTELLAERFPHAALSGTRQFGRYDLGGPQANAEGAISKLTDLEAWARSGLPPEEVPSMSYLANAVLHWVPTTPHCSRRSLPSSLRAARSPYKCRITSMRRLSA